MTLGIGEPFTTTMGIALLFALILALPVLLYEIYGFVLPAFSPRQQRAATPLVLAIPALFVAGVLFGYFVVLPSALRFFQNFNSEQFNVLVQAGQYYRFAAITLLAMGLLFQVPVGILAVTRAGIISARQLRKNRRYALLACGLIAAFLPGDAITLLLETVPLYLLFEASLLLATFIERRAARAQDKTQAGSEAQGGAARGTQPQPIATIRSIGTRARRATSSGTRTSNLPSRSESHSLGSVIIFMYLHDASGLAGMKSISGAAIRSG